MLLTSIWSSSLLAQCDSPISTIMNYNNGQDGVMFNVTSPTGITIDSVWTNFGTGTISEVRIYKRQGSFVGNTSSSSGWTFVDSALSIPSAGFNQFTSIPINLNIEVAAGDTVGLYITKAQLTQTAPYIRYTNAASGAVLGATYTSDSNAVVSYATGIDYPFGTSYGVRIWNGRMFYHCCPPADSMAGMITGDTGLVNVGDTLTFSIPWDSHAVSYQWSVPAGDSIIFGQGDSLIYVVLDSTSTGGQVCVSLFDSCSYSASKCVSYSTGYSPPIPQVQCTSPISTILNYNNGQDGVMLDISSPTGIVIDSIWSNFGTGTINEVRVYKREGTYVGNIGSSTGWNYVDSAQNIVSAGFNQYTSIPINLGIPVNAGDTVALYITKALLAQTAPWMRYTNAASGATMGAPYVSDSNMTISYAVGIDYPFGNSYSPRIWNGRIFYHCCPPTDSMAGSISGDTTNVYYGDTLTFTIPWDSHAVSYHWNIQGADSIISGQGDSSIQVLVDSSSVGGLVCVTLFDSCSYSASKCISYSICGGPPASPGPISGDTLVYYGDTVSYTVPLSLAGYTSWTHSGADSVLIGNDTSIVLLIDSSSTGGQVCFTLTNLCATSDATCMTYSICTPPSFNESIVGPSTVCPGDTLSFTMPIGINGYDYIWTIGGGDSILSGQGDSIVQVLVDSNSSGGTLCVSYEDDCTLGEDTCISYSLYSIPSLSIWGPDTVNAGDTVWYYSASDSTYTMFEWGYPTGCSLLTGSLDSILLIFGSDSGHVELMIEDVCGDIDTARIYVVVLDTTTGIQSSRINRMRIYPNPAYRTLRVEFESAARRELRLIDVHGRVILNGVLTRTSNNIDVSSCSEGIYFLEIERNSESLVERLIIISD